MPRFYLVVEPHLAMILRNVTTYFRPYLGIIWKGYFIAFSLYVRYYHTQKMYESRVHKIFLINNEPEIIIRVKENYVSTCSFSQTE